MLCGQPVYGPRYVEILLFLCVFLSSILANNPFEPGKAAYQHHLYLNESTLEPCSVTSYDGPSTTGWQLHKTAATQAFLHGSQNPADCSKAKYLIASRHPGGGLGSQLMVLSMALTAAVNSKRVLILPRDSQSSPYHDEVYCQAATNLDGCYLRPISHCATEELYAEIQTAGVQPKDIYNAIHRGKKFVWIDLTLLLRKRGELPDQEPLMDWFLQETSLVEHKWQYWWRSQAVAFFFHPNPRLQEAVSAARVKYFGAPALPPGAIAVHVRRGDKARETANTPFQKYLDAAETIGSTQPEVERVLFISAESEEAVRWFEANATGWRVLFTNLPRPNAADIPAFIRTGPSQVLIDSLVDLEIALECKHFVGTLSSNWSLLLDKLRSTTYCKAGSLFVDPSQGYPPQTGLAY